MRLLRLGLCGADAESLQCAVAAVINAQQRERVGVGPQAPPDWYFELAVCSKRRNAPLPMCQFGDATAPTTDRSPCQSSASTRYTCWAGFVGDVAPRGGSLVTERFSAGRGWRGLAPSRSRLADA